MVTARYRDGALTIESPVPIGDAERKKAEAACPEAFERHERFWKERWPRMSGAEREAWANRKGGNDGA